jgi:hypothetical protein
MLEELRGIKNEGLAKSAEVYAALSAVQPPLDPISTFKAACAKKCAEMIARFASTEGQRLPELLNIIADFMDSTIKTAGGGEAGNKDDGLRASNLIEDYMPLTDEAYNDPKQFAIRAHAFDGLLLLTAQRFGKEEEVKQHIATMQRGFMKVVLKDILGGKHNRNLDILTDTLKKKDELS